MADAGTKHFQGIELHVGGDWIIAKRDGELARYPLSFVTRVQ